MSNLPEVIELGPEEEARRLWRGAEEALTRAPESFVALSEALDLGIRAAEILVVYRLQPVKANFPATIALLLDMPDPEVDIERDAIATPKALHFTDAIDLISEEECTCVSPGLHRGWEDRRFACRRSRHTAAEALGISIGGAERDRLLMLAAYGNRIFRCPPPVRVRPRELIEAFAPLEKLVAALEKS